MALSGAESSGSRRQIPSQNGHNVARHKALPGIHVHPV